uniref:Metalloendopeptidase n=1 Tax=Parastrongyloides trichosuri TaxID=131310 RepID=A0A0N5A4H2_PARTI
MLINNKIKIRLNIFLLFIIQLFYLSTVTQKQHNSFPKPTEPIKWNNQIPYWVNVLSDADFITGFLKKIEKHTCLQFIKHTNYFDNQKGLHFIRVEDYTRAEHIGPFPNKNIVNVYVKYNWDAVHNKGLIESAIHNALGAVPENNRCDRDKYITVYKDRMKEQYKNFFELNNYSCPFLKGISYDYGSITHDTCWEKEIDPTIGAIFRAKHFPDFYQRTMGHKEFATFNDYKMLNYILCSDKCKPPKIKCYFGGYPNPKNCSQCLCPPGFTGDDCIYIVTKVEHITWRAYPYKESEIIYTQNEIKRWGDSSSYSRYLYITAPIGKKVWFHHIESQACKWGKQYCISGRGHEIRYRADKGPMGICLCDSIYWKFPVVSEDNLMVVYYNGMCNWHLLIFEYATCGEKVDCNGVKNSGYD